jgi:tRNA threonylcarbamoyladenosine biosynthesis protein TsaE
VRQVAVELPDEDSTVAFGERLAAGLAPGMLLFLEGELGAGKTTLTRGVAYGLGHRGAVKSPTYTLVEPYRDLRLPLYHFDLYRLADPEELEFLGIRDYFSGDSVVLIEWPQRGAAYLPAPSLEIRIDVLPAGRRLVLAAGDADGERCLAALADALPTAARHDTGVGPGEAREA